MAGNGTRSTSAIFSARHLSFFFLFLISFPFDFSFLLFLPLPTTDWLHSRYSFLSRHFTLTLCCSVLIFLFFSGYVWRLQLVEIIQCEWPLQLASFYFSFSPLIVVDHLLRTTSLGQPVQPPAAFLSGSFSRARMDMCVCRNMLDYGRNTVRKVGASASRSRKK